MDEPDPRLPPLFTSHPVDASARPFDAAVRGAADGRYGAGDLVWSRNAARVELALVLEPDVPLPQALQMGPLMWVAVMESLAAAMPPKTSLLLRWPDLVLVNGGEAGRLHFAVARSSGCETPAWLVIGASVQLASLSGEREPGEVIDRTSLVEEGGGDLTSSELLGSIAAHALTWINTWQEEGFAPVHDAWIGRVEGHEDSAVIVHLGDRVTGRVIGIDDTMSLIVRPATGAQRSFPVADIFAADRERALP